MGTTTDLTQDGVIIRMPFKGYAQTFMKGGKIMYATSTTFEEYNAANGGNMKLISWEEFNTMHAQLYHVPFSEITEAEYDEMLNCLPPLKWHDLNARYNIFFCSEAMSGSFHGAYVYDRESKTYYSGQINIFTKDAEIIKLLEKYENI